MKLWCIQIPGPDEYHAAPSLDAALKMAARHNDAMAGYFAKHAPSELAPNRGLCMAAAVEWPFTAESHAAAMAGFDYAGWGLKGGAA